MAAKGGRIDFMFLAPPLPGRWIRYCPSSEFCKSKIGQKLTFLFSSTRYLQCTFQHVARIKFRWQLFTKYHKIRSMRLMNKLKKRNYAHLLVQFQNHCSDKQCVILLINLIKTKKNITTKQTAEFWADTQRVMILINSEMNFHVNHLVAKIYWPYVSNKYEIYPM